MVVSPVAVPKPLIVKTTVQISPNISCGDIRPINGPLYPRSHTFNRPYWLMYINGSDYNNTCIFREREEGDDKDRTQGEPARRSKFRVREMVRKGGVVFDESPPDDFDPANPYKDPVAMLEMREHLVREKWIDIETAKILREKVKWCYRIEGINHLQKCRDLVTQYLESTRGIGWGKDSRPPDLHGPKDLFD